jgi:HD-GYP domain-containing protein (c-di-GMP phosphodiesterase class II)
MQTGELEPSSGGAFRPASVTANTTTLPLAVLLPIMDAIEARERYPRSRVRNIAMYAVALARVLDLSPAMVATIRLGALLCNLGMLRVPETILRKETSLTSDEQLQIRNHPVYGAELLGVTPAVRDITPIVLHHHEDWSGNGYPVGISGDRIPLGARIVRICETYDALTCERPYRSAYPPAEALKALHAGSGRQFDPRIAYEFRQMMRQEPERDAVLDPWDEFQTSELAWRVVAATTGLRP